MRISRQARHASTRAPSCSNADSATIRGTELEATIQPMENLDVSLSYSYMDGEYDDFTLTQWPDPLRGGTTMTSCDGPVKVPTLGQSEVEVDLSCIPFQNLPENIATLTARYSVPLGDAFGELILIGNVNYRDEQYSSATTHPRDDPRAMIESYHVFNLSAEWNGIMGSSVDARAFVNNVADETYRLNNYIGLQQASGFTNSIYGEPRMYGLSLRYRFGGAGG
ncbi:MAG: TonB-dependent receptor [Gammaproteobacteria bacterium]|nr:TonB-dependent receptor [Gammaproteobacteria bacterium]